MDLCTPHRPARRPGRLPALALFAAALYFVGMMASAVARPPAVSAAPVWTPDGSLNVPRAGHTATVLRDGRVLVAAGAGTAGGSSVPLTAAELYDPRSGAWVGTGALATPRFAHTATLLNDGRVLVAGGLDGQGRPLASAELYDPGAGRWTETGHLGHARGGHAAALLADGRVLVVGGIAGPDAPLTAETYDPATGAWSPTAAPPDARIVDVSLTPLADGRLLAVATRTRGVPALTPAALYDPRSGTWSPTGSLHTAREGGTAVGLGDGRVLVLGGWCDAIGGGCGPGDAGGGPRIPLATAEIYDPAAGVWSDTDRLATPRAGPTATLLSDGRVLIAGGARSAQLDPLASAELYDPATGRWSSAGEMAIARQGHTASLLPDGRVLVAGGLHYDARLQVEAIGPAELYGEVARARTVAGAADPAAVAAAAVQRLILGR